MNSKADLAIIGAGAAGMMAALYAAQSGVRPLILEKNEKAGKKIYITGKGRCNLTNDCDLQEFLREVPVNPRFLYAALKALSPHQMIYVVRHLMHHAAVPLDNGEGIKIVEILVVAVYKSDSERLFFQISQRYASFFHKVVDKPEIFGNVITVHSV